MNSGEFDIIFRGDIVVGHQLQDVKARLQQLFKTDATKVDALFTGRPVPLKRNLDEATAGKYREVLLKAGAQVEVRPSAEFNTAPARPANATASAVQAASAPAKRQADASTAVWTLAPAGSRLLAPSELPKVTPVVVDVSAISLRPSGGNLLDPTEVKAAPAAEVSVPNFEVAALGSALADASGGLDLPLVEVDTMDWDLAEVGSDLIHANERPQTAAPVVHVGDFGLAPVGSDLGQLKTDIKPVVPDISSIRLAD